MEMVVHPKMEEGDGFGVRNALGADVKPGKLQWNNLEFRVTVKKVEKVILKGVSGSVHPGELLAIMGPSGCGKSSLLDILHGHITGSTVSGTILFNDAPRPKNFGRFVSYVPQHDTLLGSFTVYETLEYAAALVLNFSVSPEEKKAAIERVIEDVGLKSATHTRVGDIFFKGLSGGQKRRLSMAVELLAKPSIMLLDEPTSGLDSSAAYGVMKNLLQLTSKGMCVVTTIHQPSSDVWSLFDKLCLMVEGNVVYYGPATDAIDYFARRGYECPKFSNPADFFIKLINTDFEGHADVKALIDSYKASAGQNELSKPATITDVASTGCVTPVWWQTVVLGHRNLMNNAKNPGIYAVRLVMYIMLSLMVGLMYLNVGDKSNDKSITSRISLLFYVAAFLVFMSVAVLPFFLIDRATYLRERSNGNYEVLPYVLGTFITNLPGLFLIALLSSILVVFPAKLNGFPIFLLDLFLSLIIAEGFMAVMSALVPHYIIGIALAAGVYGFFMLCEGFLISKNDIPPWFIWGYYMAFHTYSFRVFMYNEFHSIHSFKDHTNPTWATGDGVLSFYNMANASLSDDLITLAGYAIAFQVLYYVILKLTDPNRRR